MICSGRRTITHQPGTSEERAEQEEDREEQADEREAQEEQESGIPPQLVATGRASNVRFGKPGRPRNLRKKEKKDDAHDLAVAEEDDVEQRQALQQLQQLQQMRAAVNLNSQGNLNNIHALGMKGKALSRGPSSVSSISAACGGGHSVTHSSRSWVNDGFNQWRSGHGSHPPPAPAPAQHVADPHSSPTSHRAAGTVFCIACWY